MDTVWKKRAFAIMKRSHPSIGLNKILKRSHRPSIGLHTIMKKSHLPFTGLNNTKKKSVEVSWWPVLMDTSWRMSAFTIMSKLSSHLGLKKWLKIKRKRGRRSKLRFHMNHIGKRKRALKLLQLQLLFPKYQEAKRVVC
jgi:hypothetical protein